MTAIEAAAIVVREPSFKLTAAAEPVDFRREGSANFPLELSLFHRPAIEILDMVSDEPGMAPEIGPRPCRAHLLELAGTEP
jgi:hypothetical protein